MEESAEGVGRKGDVMRVFRWSPCGRVCVAVEGKGLASFNTRP